MTHELKLAGEEYFDRQNALFIYAETPVAELNRGKMDSSTYHRAVGDDALALRNTGMNRRGLLSLAGEIKRATEDDIGYTNEVPRYLKLIYSAMDIQMARRPLDTKELMIIHEKLRNPGLYLKTDFKEVA